MKTDELLICEQAYRSKSTNCKACYCSNPHKFNEDECNEPVKLEMCEAKCIPYPSNPVKH